jgi:UDP-2,3-diacylglucosamine pyrophosphatase LpxH
MNKLFCCGDIHGDFDRLILLLQKHNLINEHLNWIGGDSTLILIGDLTDRGTQGIQVIKLIMSIEKEAQDQGGKVVSIVGNHDALIVARAAEFQGDFADKDCAFIFEYNGGINEEAYELSQGDEMMNWMINRPLIHKEGDNLFQHADTMLFYNSLGSSIDQINEHGLQLMSSGKGAYDIFCRMCDCRFWDKYIHRNVEQNINQYLDKHGVKRVFHGHTRFIGNEPEISYDGKVINLDGSLSCGYRHDEDRGFLVEIK